MNDEECMRLALKLAAKGTPSPNPYVGAIIVKDGKIIGKGYHKKAGMPHAEAEAINSIGRTKPKTGNWEPPSAAGATMYVTLEPCSHYGRTPPCTDAIIKAGIRRVVFAMKDPNQNVSGNGEAELRKNGIEIEKGVLENEAKKLNEIFIKYATTKMPFVLLKAAITLDGKMATRTGDSKWITDEKEREFARKMRDKYDAILVGINTVLKDNPNLGGVKRDPLRVILDSGLKIPLDAQVLRDGNFAVFTTEKCNNRKMAQLEAKGGKIIICGKENVDLKDAIKKLGELGITSLFVEGGAKVHGSFIDAKLFDKIMLVMAPKVLGGGIPFANGSGPERIADALEIRDLKSKRIGNSIMLEGYKNY